VATNEATDQQDTPSGKKRSRIADLGPGWISAIAAALGVILTGVGLLISNAGGGGGGSQIQTVAQKGVTLPPAVVPAHGAVCSTQLHDGADGNIGPLTCSNGALNELAWSALVGNNLLVMSLGPNVNQDQVLRAMCNDLASGGSTVPVEQSAYTLSALYYNWQFGVKPSDEFPDSC
jgi:hypothetical protein